MLYLHNTNETTGVLKQDYKEGSNVVNNWKYRMNKMFYNVCY
jgi:hypothetical protein